MSQGSIELGSVLINSLGHFQTILVRTRVGSMHTCNWSEYELDKDRAFLGFESGGGGGGGGCCCKLILCMCSMASPIITCCYV